MKILANQLKLGERVTFHPGYQGDTYLGALHESDVYFLPSFRESTPVTLLEACLAGCYPLVADTSAQGEIVGIIGGRAVPAQDISGLIRGLSEGVIWCAQNRAAMHLEAEKAGAAVARHSSSEHYKMTIEAAYAVALKRTNPDTSCLC